MASALRSSLPDRTPARTPDLSPDLSPDRTPHHRAVHHRDRRDQRPASVTVLVPPSTLGDRVLERLKQASGMACSALLLAAGLAYGDQVYVNVQAENARDRLVRLKDDAHQLSVSIEALKYQAAQLGESADAGLVLPTPDHFIFVEPTLSEPMPPVVQATTAPPPFLIAY